MRWDMGRRTRWQPTTSTTAAPDTYSSETPLQATPAHFKLFRPWLGVRAGQLRLGDDARGSSTARR